MDGWVGGCYFVFGLACEWRGVGVLMFIVLMYE